MSMRQQPDQRAVTAKQWVCTNRQGFDCLIRLSNNIGTQQWSIRGDEGGLWGLKDNPFNRKK